MNTDPSAPENDANLSGLGRALLETGGSKPASGPWVPLTAEELGKLLPDYEIVKMLGCGGMGAVYMGRQKSLDRAVAIKILSTALEDADPSFAERFKNEARAMGKLNHPGIVSVHDFGEAEGGLLYIVMEYVEGTDVARMIAKEGRLHTEHAMAITAHVCDALAYAHERGIIHRDIKPANIMVGYDGVVKVADFGLAKMTHSNATGLTQSGMAMGTLHYMAPEALMLGSAVDHRADIYAVGVMLYQMLTGKIPQGMFELPSLQVKGLDPRYDGIIAKALREDREVRYQTVREMRGDLDAILTQPVARVEAPVERDIPAQPPAALPTEVRPQRPGARQPMRPQQPSANAQPAAKSSSAWLVWTTLIAIGALAAWFFFAGSRSPVDSPPSHPATQTALADAASVPTAPPKAADPHSATKDAPFVNSLGMRFVPVPLIGVPTQGKTLLFSVWETRMMDYDVFARETGRAWKKPSFNQTPEHAAVMISWDDARSFCEWLTFRERNLGGIGPKDQYRLPTDHEWSCAVGIGNKENAADTPASKDRKLSGIYPWGTQWPPPKGSGNYNGSETAADPFKGKALDDYDDGHPRTSPVGLFVPNSLGLHDLGGNVIEWCGNSFDGTDKKTARGSSWRDGQEQYHASSNRFGLPPGMADERTGFRVILELSGPAVTASPPATTPPEAAKRIDGLVANGQWQDVLPKVAVSSNDRRGDWSYTGGVLSADAHVGRSYTLSIPSQRMDHYQARLRFASSAFRNVGLFLPSPGGSFTFGVNQHRNMVGPFGSTADTQNKLLEVPVDDGKEHELLVDVSPDRLAASIDGKPVYAWANPPWATITSPGDYPFTRAVVIGVGAHGGLIHFHSLQFRLPSAEAVSQPVMTLSSAPVFDLQQIPEFRTRVANYQKTRHAQLSELTSKYRAALTAEKDAATKSGVLAAVTSAEAALAAATGLSQVIEANLTATEVKPLPAIAEVPDNAPPRLKELRSIFVSEIAKIETTLVSGLDSSLATVQATLVQADKLSEAKAVEDYRKAMLAAFKIAQASASSSPVTATPSNGTTTNDPAQSTKDKPFVNSLGMKFVPVPGTEVMFCIHETRYKDYAAYAAETAGVDVTWRNQGDGGILPAERPEDHPVMRVSWEDAQKFCAWLSQKEGKRYRLPTDAEWSSAVGLASEANRHPGTTPARLHCKDQTSFPWGGDYPPRTEDLAGNYSDQSRRRHAPREGASYVDGYEDGFPNTAPVMSFRPNSFGLYDMGGNVWEWCEDWWDQAPRDRVLRGGAWVIGDRTSLLSSVRKHHAPNDRNRYYGGFRVVLELP